MKKNQIINLSFFLVLLIGCTESFPLLQHSDNSVPVFRTKVTNTAEIVGPFSFPASDEIKQLSIRDKLAACQIPEELLPNISTNELVDLCLNYPLMSDARYSATPEYAVYTILRQFNGFIELQSRDSYLDAIIDAIDIRVADFTCRRTVLGDGRDVFYEKFFLWTKLISMEAKRSKSAEVLLAVEERIVNWFSITGLDSWNKEDLSLETRERIQTSIYYNGQHYPLITPFGTEVYSAIYRAEIYPQDADELDKFSDWLEKNHPYAEAISGPSSQYNCHFYAWNGLSQGLRIWVSNPCDYWLDGSYDETTASDPEATIVFYYNGNDVFSFHSGIIQQDGKIISKWGEGGLVRHELTDVPIEYGQSYRYFKPHIVKIEEDNQTIIIPDEGFTVSRMFHVIGAPNGSSVSWAVSGIASILSGQGTDSLTVELGGDAQVFAHITVPPGGILNRGAMITARYLMPRLNTVTFISGYDNLQEESVLALLSYRNSEMACSWSVLNANGGTTDLVQLWNLDYSGDALLAGYPFNEMRELNFASYGNYTLCMVGFNAYGKSTLTVNMQYTDSGFVFGEPARSTEYYLLPPPPPPLP